MGFVQVVGVSDTHVGVGEGDSHVAGTSFAVHGVAHNDRGGFGEAVAFDEGAVCVVLPTINGANWQSGGSGEGVADTFDIHAGFFGGVDNFFVEGGYTGQPGGGVALHYLHDEFQVRRGQEDDFPADEYPEGGHHGESVGVEHGQRRKQAFFLLAESRHPGFALQDVGHEVAVAKLRAFGGAGGAGGVQNECRGVAGDVGGAFNVGAVATDCGID